MEPVEEPLDADGGLLETSAAEKPEVQSRDNLDRVAQIQPPTPTNEKFAEGRGQKRPADDDCDGEGESGGDGDGDDANGVNDDASQNAGTETEVPKLSKNKLRKLKRQKMWEVKKQEKKGLRKEKRHKQQERRRLEREAEIAAAVAEGREPVFHEPPKRQPISATKVPVSVIIDCQFEKYMMEKELVSLGSQITRCYSDNRNTQFPVHMFISSYGGQMKERFETVLTNQHKHWKNVHFSQGDFVEAAAEAKSLMQSPEGGQVIELLSQGKEGDSVSIAETTNYTKKQLKSAPVPEPEADDVDKSIVYLTADSPYTLDRLEPNTCYVIGGIIDKNREKGLCYKIARQKNVRTAKLPIGDFMVMQSRHVLTTNHVMEIMLRWLETGDWGAAFVKVIPTRKGGKLKGDEETPEIDEEQSEEATKEAESKIDAIAIEDTEMAEPNIIQPGEPVVQEQQGVAEIEGDNSEEGLQKNSLDQQRWSAPPIEQEQAEAPISRTTS
ncbi:guanine-1-methyltransferase-domain-containing protein [Hypoxylon rubiginosum]|uniref:Guanine-1-methyltransferase-domain-containing protein n=1 Tax=Hypoxylon rubiginosum TaxID=110542 RepID=A0ACB9YSZ2_9PEZI|nr:guanine-1-methyltransferase-domain-containing protein [Hypoxylon rubiginosum]